MKVYIAGPYSQRLTLLERANELVAASDGRIEITSTWLQGEHEAKDHTATIWEQQVWAADDLRDIDAADTLIQFTEWPSTRGGAHCEFMYAITKGKEVWVCGPSTTLNVFHAYHMVWESAVGFDDWPELMGWFNEVFVAGVAPL